MDNYLSMLGLKLIHVSKRGPLWLPDLVIHKAMVIPYVVLKLHLHFPDLRFM